MTQATTAGVSIPTGFHSSPRLVSQEHFRDGCAARRARQNVPASRTSPSSRSPRVNRVCDEVCASRRRAAALQPARQPRWNKVRRGRQRHRHHGLQLSRWRPATGQDSIDELPGEGHFSDSRLAEIHREPYWITQILDAMSHLATIASNAGWLDWGVGSPLTPGFLLVQ